METTFADTPAPTPTSRRRRSAWHIVAIVFGGLLLLPGLATMTGGGAALVAQAVATDDDGYFRVTLDPIESDGVAVTADEVWFDDVEDEAATWLVDWLDVDLRLRVDGAAATDDVFVGVARTADVEAYLDGAGHSEVVEIEDDRSPRYVQVLGSRSVGAPVDEDFWTVSATGTGEQELVWEARGGRWSIVVMNADGSPAVDADVEIGLRSDAVTPIGVTLLVLGGLVAVAAITLIVIGIRGRRSPDAPPAGPAIGTPLAPPTPGSAVDTEEATLERTSDRAVPVA
jgi:hypothetical protein